MLELLRGLPVRLENRIRFELNKITLKGLFVFLFRSVLLVLVVTAILGIIEGISYDFWQESFVPWWRTKYDRVTYGRLMFFGGLCTIGWGGTMVLGLFATLFYGTDRRRLGQLEEVGKENADREKQINELNQEIGRLGSELQYAHQTRGYLLAMFSSLDRELVTLLTQNSKINNKSVVAFYESACRRLFNYFSSDSHVFRSSVYLPDSLAPEFLVIHWDYGVGEVSRRWNRWYIGNQDPDSLKVHRGIPGKVFLTKSGRVNENVRNDPDFYDAYEPPRPRLPYNGVLHALIHPDNPDEAYGVFCVDSLTYQFDERDLEIAQLVAIRLGWLIKHIKNST